MTSLNLLELAQQGNPEAIASLMNRSLQPRGTTAKAVLKDGCLKILLEAAEVPNRESLIAYVTKGITSLMIPSLNTVQIYGKKSGAQTLAWTHTFQVQAARSPVTASEVNQNVTSSELSQNISATLELEPANSAHQNTQDTQQSFHSNPVEDLSILINRTLEEKNLTAKVSLEDSCLMIVIETSQFLDSDAVVKPIHQQLIGLKSTQIKSAKVYKQKLNSTRPFLMKEFILVAPETPEVAPEKSPISQSVKASSPSVSHQSQATKTQEPRKENINETRKQLNTILIIFIGTLALIFTAFRIARLLALPQGAGVLIAVIVAVRAYLWLSPLLQYLIKLRND